MGLLDNHFTLLHRIERPDQLSVFDKGFTSSRNCFEGLSIPPKYLDLVRADSNFKPYAEPDYYIETSDQLPRRPVPGCQRLR